MDNEYCQRVPRRESSVGDDNILLRTSTLRFRKNIVVARPIFSQDKFDSSQELGEHGAPTSPWGKLQREVHHKIHTIRNWHYSDWHPNYYRLLIGFLVRTFPILHWLPQYKIREYLPKDLISGFTVGIMNIPQGMAYALLAAMPAVFGLYTSFFPVLVYTLMATSRHVSVGVFAIVSIMTGKVVNRYALPHTPVAAVPEFIHNLTIPGITDSIATDATDVNSHLESRIRVVIALTVSVGIWQLIMGVFGLGYLTVYLSDQLVKGFTTGSAFHVFTSQLRPIFGLRKLKEYNGAFKLIYTYIDFFGMIKDTHVPTLIVSMICIVFLLLVKYLFNDNMWIQRRLPLRLPIPGELLVVIFGAFASYMMSLGSVYGVDIVGLIPLGMPAPHVPDLSILPAFAVDSFVIAIVSFAITLSLSKLYATKYKYEFDASQELRALGCSNIFGGFFQCIPTAASLGRTAVQASIGGVTQLVSLVSAVFVLIVLLALGRLMEPLPKACLGCVILVALIGMLKQVVEVKRLWRISAVDTSVFLVSLLSTVILDVDIGLGVAVGWSLLTVVFRTQRPDVCVLGRALHTDIYKRIDVYKSTSEVEGCKIIRFDAPLYFANAEYFTQRVRSTLGNKLPRGPRRAPEKLVTPWESRRTSYISPTTVESPSPSPSSPTNHSPEHRRPSAVSIEMDSFFPSPAESSKRVPSAEIVYYASNRNTHTSSVDAATWTADYFDQPVRHIILDCSSMCFIDVNGIQAVKDLAKEMIDVGISLFLASCKANMRESLALCGYSDEINANHLYLTVHDAVMAAIRERREVQHHSTDEDIKESDEEDEVFDMDFPGLSSIQDRNKATFGTQTAAPPIQNM